MQATLWVWNHECHEHEVRERVEVQDVPGGWMVDTLLFGNYTNLVITRVVVHPTWLHVYAMPARKERDGQG